MCNDIYMYPIVSNTHIGKNGVGGEKFNSHTGYEYSVVSQICRATQAYTFAIIKTQILIKSFPPKLRRGEKRSRFTHTNCAHSVCFYIKACRLFY